MKFRPQMQLRFRDADHYERIKKAAKAVSLSANEFILRALEGAGGGTGRRTPVNGAVVEDGAVGHHLAGSNPASRTKTRRMSDDEFSALSNSDKLRATREGRY